MKFKKRNLILSILVLSIFLLQSTALASAIYRPPGGDPPPTTTTYRVYGYVTDVDTGLPINGARVKIYRGTTSYIGQDYTDSNGYYNFYYRTTLTITKVKSVASKSGYYTSSRVGYMLEGRVRLDHSLTEVPPPPPPPTAPIISNVEITQGGVREVIVSWDVTWGTGATQYYVECYWGTDANLDSGDKIYYQVVSSATTTFSCQVPLDQITYTSGTYYYKVHAQNTNSAGSSDDTIGPSSILVNAFWKIHPTDDAYTVEEDYYGNYGDEPELKVRDYQGYCRYSWLKFSIENPEVVKSAMLCVRISDVESNGHGTIRAYSTATSWTEDTISESNAPLFGDWIADDSSGTAGSWDYWDISNFANSANTISIRLLCQSGINEGATYYSKEYSTVHYRPYLVVEYWGAPQDPIMVTGSEANSFVDEHFNNPDLDTEAWISHSYSPDTEWDYDIVREGLSYYEGTVLKFQDSVIAQHSEWRGYYFEQEHLDIRNAFRFETKLGWALDDMDSPAVQLGVELLDEEGFTITSIYFDYGGYWGNYAYIHGDIGATSNSWSTELYPPVITSPHDAMFEIERDLEGNIVLTYWKVFAQGSASYPYEIHTGTDTRNVNTVRLFCREKTPYDYAYSFSAWFDSIKETRKTTLGNPESIAPFTNPIEEQSFNSQLTKWFNPSGGAPIGSLISSVAIDGNAWHVNIDNDEWAIYQSLNGDRNDFKFAAIENKRVSFTFFALRDNSDSRVCAMIKYTSPGDREPKVVVGDWVLLANDGEWQQVAVTTTWRLPPNIESLEVWIIGEALLYNDFSAVIDESRLVIINDDIISQEHNYDATHGGECGIVSVNLATVYAQKPDGWSVKVIPIVVAQAASGFYISKISIDFAVSHGIADIAENGALEANDKEYQPDGFDLEEWNEICSFWKGVVKWGTRITLFAFGVGAPISWVFGDVMAGLADIILKPHKRFAEDSRATPDDSGWMDVDYPPAEQIMMGTSCLHILWNMASSYENPELSVTFTVEFVTNGGLYAYRSVSSMSVTFPTN